MKMDDMVIISVDDHVCEPGDMFDRHLSGDALASAPKLRTKSTARSSGNTRALICPRLRSTP